MELFLKGEHLGNLVSLTAPVHPEPKQLFRWSNDFAWSYGGNVADSIKERVKKAGGKVEGNPPGLAVVVQLRRPRPAHPRAGGAGVRAPTAWRPDLLPQQARLDRRRPRRRHERRRRHTREPVENVRLAGKMPVGRLQGAGEQLLPRETSARRLRRRGRERRQALALQLQQGRGATRAGHPRRTLHVKDGRIESVEIGDPAITARTSARRSGASRRSSTSRSNAVTLSPNYWGDNAVGNKHTFFVLDGARATSHPRHLQRVPAPAPGAAPQGVRDHRRQDQVPADGRPALGARVLVDEARRPSSSGCSRASAKRAAQRPGLADQIRYRPRTRGDTTMNIFEYAIRNKLRFASSRGELTVEQLFDVPLRSSDGFNLNESPRRANKTLKDMSEENFVETSRNTPSHVRAEKGAGAGQVRHRDQARRGAGRRPAPRTRPRRRSCSRSSPRSRTASSRRCPRRRSSAASPPWRRSPDTGRSGGQRLTTP
jgi:hypothetical protein